MRAASVNPLETSGRAPSPLLRPMPMAPQYVRPRGGV
jgi:hypothetical protein